MKKISRINVKALILLQLVFMIYSFAGVASKKASEYNFLSPKFLGFYITELVIMMVYAYLWQQVIKKFDLITAYSSKGVVIIWTLIWSMLFFHEKIKINNIIGAIVVILGIMMVVKDGK